MIFKKLFFFLLSADKRECIWWNILGKALRNCKIVWIKLHKKSFIWTFQRERALEAFWLIRNWSFFLDDEEAQSYRAKRKDFLSRLILFEDSGMTFVCELKLMWAFFIITSSLKFPFSDGFSFARQPTNTSNVPIHRAFEVELALFLSPKSLNCCKASNDKWFSFFGLIIYLFIIFCF